MFPLLLAFKRDIENTRLAFRIVLVDIKGDWPAITELFGVRNWNHKEFPCPIRRVPLSQLLHVMAGYTIARSPFDHMTQDFHRAEIACNFRVGALMCA